jgi:colanic acid biosynthesis glycosyl transferase WcaI
LKDNSKRILIIGINYAPEITGIGRYTGEMAQWLAENGYKCSVVTSFPYYPNWKVQPPYKGWFYKKEVSNNGNLVVYRCPFYVPKVPSGLKRIVHEASFFLSAFFQIFILLFKPGHRHIFCIAPPFHLGFLALFYRFFKGGNINYHIQDLQIEAARDLKVVKAKFAFSLLFALEKFILKRVDTISSISSGMLDKIIRKSGRKVYFFANWVDTENFFPIPDKEGLKALWGFGPDDKVVLYSGSIGEKQGLDSLIDIAIRCRDNANIKLIICGTGPYKQKLEQLAKDSSAGNVFFLPLQGNDVFNKFLNFADVHLVLQKKEASDLVMPSKLTTILATGGLVIATAEKGTSLYSDIQDHSMGLVIPPEDNDSLYEAIVYAGTHDFTAERANARAYAERYLNKRSILKGMSASILESPQKK